MAIVERTYLRKCDSLSANAGNFDNMHRTRKIRLEHLYFDSLLLDILRILEQHTVLVSRPIGLVLLHRIVAGNRRIIIYSILFVSYDMFRNQTNDIERIWK